jgi:hypothetical protein
MYRERNFLIQAEVIGETVISTDGDIRKYYDDSSIDRKNGVGRAK